MGLEDAAGLALVDHVGAADALAVAGFVDGFVQGFGSATGYAGQGDLSHGIGIQGRASGGCNTFGPYCCLRRGWNPRGHQQAVIPTGEVNLPTQTIWSDAL